MSPYQAMAAQHEKKSQVIVRYTYGGLHCILHSLDPALCLLSQASSRPSCMLILQLQYSRQYGRHDGRLGPGVKMKDVSSTRRRRAAAGRCARNSDFIDAVADDCVVGAGSRCVMAPLATDSGVDNCNFADYAADDLCMVGDDVSFLGDGVLRAHYEGVTSNMVLALKLVIVLML